MDSPFGDQELQLDYPCEWTYTLIGSDEPSIRQAIQDTIRERRHTLRAANTSRHGRYRSFHLELTVIGQEDRRALFEDLRQHPDIRYVL